MTQILLMETWEAMGIPVVTPKEVVQEFVGRKQMLVRPGWNFDEFWISPILPMDSFQPGFEHGEYWVLASRQMLEGQSRCGGFFLHAIHDISTNPHTLSALCLSSFENEVETDNSTLVTAFQAPTVDCVVILIGFAHLLAKRGFHL